MKKIAQQYAALAFAVAAGLAPSFAAQAQGNPWRARLCAIDCMSDTGGSTTHLNFDVKKVQFRTDAQSAGNKTGDRMIAPLLVGLGIGSRS